MNTLNYGPIFLACDVEDGLLGVRDLSETTFQFIISYLPYPRISYKPYMQIHVKLLILNLRGGCKHKISNTASVDMTTVVKLENFVFSPHSPSEFKSYTTWHWMSIYKFQMVRRIRSTFKEYEYTAAVVQRVRAFASQAKGWVFESQSRQTYVVKTGSDSSTAKRSAIESRVLGDDLYKRMPRVTVSVARQWTLTA